MRLLAHELRRPDRLPGQPGRAHLHAYFGNTDVDASTTAESLATTGSSTCRGGIANRSSYWVPAMIDTATGWEDSVRPQWLTKCVHSGGSCG